MVLWKFVFVGTWTTTTGDHAAWCVVEILVHPPVAGTIRNRSG